MEIKLFNHIVQANYDPGNLDFSVVEQITQHTAETWQPDRQGAERGSNTKQGKIAEDIVGQFITQQYSTDISLLSYDEIRNDNFEKHAPFGFLIFKTGTEVRPVAESVRNDIAQAPDQFVRMSEHTRQLCRELGVWIAEVKSTKIRAALKTDAGFNGNYNDVNQVRRLVNMIKSKDDVFCYPYYKRSEVLSNYSFMDYCEFVKTQEPTLGQLAGEALQRAVIDLEREKLCCDLFIRVYIDTDARVGLVIGWMSKEHLLDYAVQFKRMRQPNKSERALYFAKKLSESNGLDRLPDIFIKSDEQVFASPYTNTDFYHKSLNCEFIKRVYRSDVIVFADEKEAVSDGRYTRRCKICFREE